MRTTKPNTPRKNPATRGSPVQATSRLRQSRSHPPRHHTDQAPPAPPPLPRQRQQRMPLTPTRNTAPHGTNKQLDKLPGYRDRPCTPGHTSGGRSPNLRTWMVTDARQMAITNHQPAPGVIFGAGRGCQYTSQEPARFLLEQQDHPVARPDQIMCRQCRVRNSSTHPTRKKGGLVRNRPWQNPTGTGPGISGLVHRGQHAAEAFRNRLRDTTGETPRTYTARRNRAATKRSITASTKPGTLHHTAWERALCQVLERGEDDFCGLSDITRLVGASHLDGGAMIRICGWSSAG